MAWKQTNAFQVQMNSEDKLCPKRLCENRC